MPTGGEADAELAMEEPSQRPTLGHGVGWSLALSPHPYPRLGGKNAWHLPQFPSAALLLGRLSLDPGLPSCPAPGNLGPVPVFRRIIWIQNPV